MIPSNWIILAVSGISSGILAGFLGIGGGVVLVPLLVALGYQPVEAVATSTLAIAITATSGTVQNWRMGFIQPRKVLALGLPALVAVQLGVYLTGLFSPTVLLLGFGVLLLLNIYLFQLRRQVIARTLSGISRDRPVTPIIARIATGGAAGVLAGLFGVGGGVIMVPLQIVLLGEPIKAAIQTSLGVIVITAMSACVGHSLNGNVIFAAGILLGLGGLIGAQVSTRFLPQLPDRWVSLAFRILLVILATYTFWRALLLR